MLDDECFDANYDPSNEKVEFALPETQEEWYKQKQELLDKDCEMDHAKQIILS